MLDINGCRVKLFENNNFKTNSISFNIINKLSLETASKNALLVKVLSRGSTDFRSSKEIAIELESCYGATLSPKIEKIGDNQIIGFTCSYPADEFVGERVTSRIIMLLFSLIFQPLLEGSGFNQEYFEQERENLYNQIEGLKNDKRNYAIDRCAEVMFQGEAYSVCELGDIEILKEISNEELLRYYQLVIRESQIAAFLSGRFEKNIIEEFSSQLKKNLNRNSDANVLLKTSIKECLINSRPDFTNLNEFVEQLDVNQGKLTIGFTTETAPNSDDYIMMMVANSIFGGGTHSKLFAEVREKESLAYYASTMMDKYKGVIFATSGIESVNKDKAKTLILEQLKKLQNGEISDFEFQSSKKALVNSLRSLNDSQLSLQAFYFGQLLAGSVYSVELLIEKILEISLADVINISKRIKPHTVYFLTGWQDVEEV